MSLSKRRALSRLAVELGADDLVVVEAHASGRLEPAGRRLADVVEQGGEPQHEVGSGHRLERPVGRALEVDGLLEHDERVVVDVLVAVVLVHLELQGGELGQHVCREAAGGEQLEPGPGRGREQQLDQLVAHPLGRHDLDAAGHRPIAASTSGAGTRPS